MPSKKNDFLTFLISFLLIVMISWIVLFATVRMVIVPMFLEMKKDIIEYFNEPDEKDTQDNYEPHSSLKGPGFIYSIRKNNIDRIYFFDLLRRVSFGLISLDEAHSYLSDLQYNDQSKTLYYLDRDYKLRAYHILEQREEIVPLSPSKNNPIFTSDEYVIGSFAVSQDGMTTYYLDGCIEGPYPCNIHRYSQGVDTIIFDQARMIPPPEPGGLNILNIDEEKNILNMITGYGDAGIASAATYSLNIDSQKYALVKKITVDSFCMKENRCSDEELKDDIAYENFIATFNATISCHDLDVTLNKRTGLMSLTLDEKSLFDQSEWKADYIGCVN